MNPCQPANGHQIFSFNECRLLCQFPDIEIRLRFLRHIQAAPRNLIKTAVNRNYAKGTVITLSVRFQILDQILRFLFIKCFSGKFSGKGYFFQRMVILCHDDPCVVIYLLLIFQFQYQRQIIFRIFIDQILDFKFERNGIFCLRISGKLAFFDQTFTVHTPYLKGDPLNLPSELLDLTGNTASLSERADRLPFITDIRLHGITAQTVHPLPADIHIDKRQTCGTHLLGHIRISLIHKIADHHQ